MLTTGGGAALWRRTTNPWGAIGAGSVLAHRAGAELADLELCQFHPTALALPGAEQDGALITEAVRGEGAKLLDAAGERFTDELAPRDQVTAAILDRMDADGAGHVRLDLRGLSAERFPNVFEVCRRAGLDPAREPVPVAPAAHYLIGGIACDLEGRTTLAGLHAVGECACTGPARRQPARLELAQRVLRLRDARRAGRGRRRRRPATRRTRPSRRSSRRRSPPARRSGATPARAATRPGSRRCSATPTRWRG